MDLLEDTENHFNRLKSSMDDLLANAQLEERLHLLPASKILRQCRNRTTNTQIFYREINEQLKFMADYKECQILVNIAPVPEVGMLVSSKQSADLLPRFAEEVLRNLEALAFMSGILEPNKNWKMVLRKRCKGKKNEDGHGFILDAVESSDDEGDLDDGCSSNDFLFGNKFPYF